MASIDYPVLIVRSITYAMKGQKLLESNGINAYIQRNARPNSKEGCGYGLRVAGNLETALSLLSDAGIKVVEIQGG